MGSQLKKRSGCSHVFFCLQKSQVVPIYLVQKVFGELPLLPVAVYGFFDCVTFHFFVAEVL